MLVRCVSLFIIYTTKSCTTDHQIKNMTADSLVFLALNLDIEKPAAVTPLRVVVSNS